MLAGTIIATQAYGPNGKKFQPNTNEREKRTHITCRKKNAKARTVREEKIAVAKWKINIKTRFLI